MFLAPPMPRAGVTCDRATAGGPSRLSARPATTPSGLRGGTNLRPRRATARDPRRLDTRAGSPPFPRMADESGAPAVPAEDLRVELERLRLLHSISQEFNSSLDFDELLPKVFDTVVTAVGAAGGSLWIAEGDVLRCKLDRKSTRLNSSHRRLSRM